MNYDLSQTTDMNAGRLPVLASLRKLVSIISGERRNLIIAFSAIFLNSGLSLAGPYIVGYTIDNYVQAKDYHGVLLFSGILLIMYVVAFVSNYAQMRMMGGIGQRMLFSLRNSVFNKLQELPLSFFNQNKAGDLISRINNDTDKVNQFFSQSLMQFIGSPVSYTHLVMLIFPVMMIGFMSNIIASATASYDRIKRVLDEPPPAETGTVRSDIGGNIVLKLSLIHI